MIISFETDLGNITRNERLFQEMTKLVIEISDSISSYRPDTSNVEKLTALRKDYFNKQEGKTNNESIETQPNKISNDNVEENIDESNLNASKNKAFKEYKTHEFKANTKTKKGKSNNNSNGVGRKKEWENEGLLAFTNSKCYDVRDSKTMFFK